MSRLALLFSLALPMAAASMPAHAQDRPLTRAMSCTSAQNLVARQGSIVLDTDRFIYDRYVRNASFCLNQQTTKAAWVPTKDTPNCFIGYTCVEIDIDFW